MEKGVDVNVLYARKGKMYMSQDKQLYVFRAVRWQAASGNGGQAS